jgi:hypothetical protein
LKWFPFRLSVHRAKLQLLSAPYFSLLDELLITAPPKMASRQNTVRGPAVFFRAPLWGFLFTILQQSFNLFFTPMATSLTVLTQKAEQAAPIASPAQEHVCVYCPTCSARLDSSRCKLICRHCGYYMSCADYY